MNRGKHWRIVAGLALVWVAEVAQVLAAPTPIHLISFEAAWKYLADKTDPGTNWISQDFDDASWEHGQALFGVEPTFPAEYLPNVFSTFIPAPLNDGPLTTYFRTHFKLSGPVADLYLLATNLLDDGAVFYLNGKEVDRIRVPENQTYATWAERQPLEGTRECRVWNSGIVRETLHLGDNVVAVELHQSGSNSSDDVFGMTLTAIPMAPPEILDQTSLSSATNRTVEQCRFVEFSIVASSILEPKYQWYLDNQPISNATNRTYTIASMQSTNRGSYFVRVNNPSGSVDSVTVTLNYELDRTLPTLLYAWGDPNDLSTITVVFSEAIDRNPGGVTSRLSNWSVIDKGGNSFLIQKVTIASKSVMLITDPRTAGDSYDLRVDRVVDDCTRNVATNLTAAIRVVEKPLFEMATQSWRYLDTGVDLGILWRNLRYDDAGWKRGLALFDAKRDSEDRLICRRNVGPGLVNTCLALSNTFNGDLAQITNVYFRTRFNYRGDPTGMLQLKGYVDDGVIYFLNGQELTRIGFAPGPVTATTFASRVVSGDAGEETVFVWATNLVSGENVLAAQVNQCTATSSDLTFGLGVSVLTATEIILPTIKRISLSDKKMTIEWAPGLASLFASETVDGVYSRVEGATDGEFTVQANAARKFYRVRLP